MLAASGLDTLSQLVISAVCCEIVGIVGCRTGLLCHSRRMARRLGHDGRHSPLLNQVLLLGRSRNLSMRARVCETTVSRLRRILCFS